ncbi:DUF4097 family beta strand repeat-containing protein [Conexibacter woesei]|uniref:DUF4097 family beta strand repeat-containing protein n=1 Tax=Conexibacter woesei TaxID=191495 RepID=UPI00040FE26E|nr:DUF4097 family beta strand repeat-containing protein [Conexibacter woesei]
MPTFPASGPINASISIHAGDVKIVASQRDDVVVDVVPRDPDRKADVRAAETARIELSGSKLEVKTTRQGLGWSRSGVVRVEIALPEGSRLDGHTEVGDLRTEGILGACTLKSGAGAIRLGTTGKLRVVSGAGDISVDHATGDVVAVTGTGALSFGAVSGDLIVKNGNGGTRAGVVDGLLKISAANGDVAIDVARQGATVKTANGSIRLGSVASGDVDLKTAFGTVEVGIAHGTAAKLDVKTTFGLLRQELEPSATPPSSVRTATVKARTSHGDITIRRAAGDGDGEAAAA